ncbi:MAG: hypothetical protein EXR85_06720 [Xanthomonadales bacterium]|nr:hypothetical protein [Xanthomonadales bacterium]
MKHLSVVGREVIAFAISLAAVPAFAQPVAFGGGTVVDGKGVRPIENGVVVVSDSQIISVGSEGARLRAC